MSRDRKNFSSYLSVPPLWNSFFCGTLFGHVPSFTQNIILIERIKEFNVLCVMKICKVCIHNFLLRGFSKSFVTYIFNKLSKKKDFAVICRKYWTQTENNAIIPSGFSWSSKTVKWLSLMIWKTYWYERCANENKWSASEQCVHELIDKKYFS